jgi:formylglycine-generating enzyme required for sulfatase activity
MKIAAASERLQKLYNATAAEVAKSAPEPAEAPAFEQEQKDVEGALKDFRQTPFIERDVAEGKFAQRVAQIEGQIGGLKRYYHAEDAEDWLANLAPFVASSARLKSRWDAWVTTLRADAQSMADNRELFNSNKLRTDKLRDVLTELEIMIPQPPDGLTEDFARTARARREDQLDAMLKLVDSTDPAMKPETIAQSSAALAAWYADLKALNADFPVRKRLLTLEDRPDERWRKNEAFWKDAAVQRLIRADVDRIERLQKLRSATRDKLVSESSAEAVRPEVAIAAWQLLGGDGVSPPWPNTTPELLTEAALRGKVAAEAQSFDMAAPERDRLESDLAREGPRRWRRFVENATSEDMLVAALERQLPFRVDAVALSNMSPTARFNVWLCIANLATRDNNSKGLGDVVVKLQVAAEELGATGTLQKLERLKVPDPFSGRELGDVFKLEVKGVADPIEFRRVERTDAGARPFYLATREVTLGQFAGAIDGAGRWEEARKLAWPYRPGKGDARRGARIWEWTDPAAPRLGVTQLWMTSDEVSKHNDFPREFRPERSFNRNILKPALGGMPGDRHPMQYVSAHAALFYAAQLGLRLPTSAEWRTALAAGGKTVDNGNWNLRDASWEVFRKHAAKEGIAPEHWPDRGAFPGDPPPGEPVTSAPSRRGPADNALLFRQVPSNDGQFQDLIGNVAEFVCDVPDAFARHDKETADDIKRFLQDTPDAIAVIGGSALSPPDMPVDEPQRVTRPDRAYSDVGLRLAFTAPARHLAERFNTVAFPRMTFPLPVDVPASSQAQTAPDSH